MVAAAATAMRQNLMQMGPVRGPTNPIRIPMGPQNEITMLHRAISSFHQASQLQAASGLWC